MKAEIKFSISEESTLLEISEGTTDLDILLAISALFNTMSESSKYIALKRLQNLVHSETI